MDKLISNFFSSTIVVGNSNGERSLTSKLTASRPNGAFRLHSKPQADGDAVQRIVRNLQREYSMEKAESVFLIDYVFR